MKRFRFALEPVLRLRKIKEDQKLEELAKLVAEVNRRRFEIEENENRIRTTSSAPLSADANLKDYSYLQTYMRQLLTRNSELESEIGTFDQPIESKRKEVTDARKDRRVMELLKEKKYEQFLKGYKKRERITAEEVFLSKLVQIRREEAHELDKSKRDPKIFTFDTRDFERTGQEDAGLSELRKLYERYKK
ncbi:flagellar export protein FliJ [Leptospira perolatii]|uniref:Flagellar FliJ protein n=1 Tax=Leptospira perolatii TaxID=2023191 RepID=A0A2M9ZMB8_9LEPT|nr:flagellar export protein FliJ [Leptospira perolatii]PJZ70042.1 flagellar export protein FliJ [Leptospira perolatii]PJZ73230.1 flagellar export protein FliJ [Leptospira perolatii]